MSASDRKRLPAITGGPRAFPVVSEMPVGHTTVYIDDDRHWPHLKPGESALVDTTDREIVFGEVYLVRQSRGPVLWQISRFPSPRISGLTRRTRRTSRC